MLKSMRLIKGSAKKERQLSMLLLLADDVALLVDDIGLVADYLFRDSKALSSV